MTLLASSPVGYTLALVATFIGVGILVNLLIVYIIGQVLAERKANRDRQRIEEL
jgi:hypothetical protein